MKPWEEYQAKETKPWEEYDSSEQTKVDKALPKPSALASIGRGMLDVGQGLIQGALQGSEAIPGAISANERIGRFLKTTPVRAKDYSKDVQHEVNLYEEGKGTGLDIPRLGGNIIATLPTALIPGISSANILKQSLSAGAGGAISSGAQFVPEGQNRAENTLMGGTLGLIIPSALNKIKGKANSTIADKTAAAVNNAVKKGTLEASQELGYKVPPSTVNPSMTNQVLEGISGKIKTAQSASQKNQVITNAISKKYLGLPEDIPLTPEILVAKRKEYGQAYESIRNAGEIASDPTYVKELNNITSKFKGASKDFPELAKNDIEDLVKQVNKDKFDANSAIDAISILRDKADSAFRQGDKNLGKASRQAADAMESLIERNLSTKGADKELVNNFKNARQEIAKTYSIEKALNPETGNISAIELAKQLKKGKPLTGEARKAAEFATAFPKAAQDVKDSIPMISPLDYATGVISAGASGNPAMLAGVAARPSIRSMLLSDVYQNRLTVPDGPSALDRLIPSVAGSSVTRKLGPQTFAAFLAQRGQGTNNE